MNILTHQYDAAGNRTKEIDPEGKTTSFAYTNSNKLYLITDAKLNTIQYTYDAAFNKTDVKDKNGNLSHFDFDKDNRNTKATDPDGNITI